MEFVFEPDGVCAYEMRFVIEDGIIKSLVIDGGCAGNTVGVSRLIVGMSVEEAIKRLKGIPCGNRGTSCPDQVAIALEKYLSEK